jgi:hypothetical protein
MIQVTESAYFNAKDFNSIEIVFYIDSDDKPSEACVRDLCEKFPHIKSVIGERIILSQMWNKCWEVASGEIFHHAGDDILYKTKNWDEIVISEFNKVDDKILFVYGRDGIVDSDKLGTHGFVHKNWTDTVGYFVPPYFSADYNDTWLTDLAKKINRLVYLPELFIEHMHFSVGKSKLDDTYQEARRRRKRDKVRAMYREKEWEREQDADKLREFIDSF